MAVKQSASKEEFLRALGLDQQNPDHKRKLGEMWEEVTTYWNNKFETSSRAILKPEYASNLKVQRPYKWGHLNPTSINEAICEIWANGQPWPRSFYDKGRSSDPKVYNWVLKWLLWHVCRYRDWRNRKTSKPDAISSSSSGNGSSSGSYAVDAMPPHDYWATVMNQ